MSLITKYRINNIDNILGNEEAKQILKSFTKKEDHPHSYLFTGERGLGKTTFARILTNLYNCDMLEINGSNDRSIEMIRTIIYEGSKTGNLLSSNKNKAFIMDEVHGLTSQAQDALLKILEEPPKHVYFFLCTTDPQKLKPTLKSRCCKIELEKIRSRVLYPYLIDISVKENNEISKNVARQIAETSEGYVRDSLNILEKVLQFKDEEKQVKIAKQKIENNQQVIDLCRLLLKAGSFNGDIRKCLIDLQNDNPESIRKIIINYMMKVILNSGSERAVCIIDELDSIIYDYAVLVKNIYRIFI